MTCEQPQEAWSAPIRFAEQEITVPRKNE